MKKESTEMERKREKGEKMTLGRYKGEPSSSVRFIFI